MLKHNFLYNKTSKENLYNLAKFEHVCYIFIYIYIVCVCVCVCVFVYNKNVMGMELRVARTYLC